MTQKETNEEILQKLYDKLNRVLPETVYISAENAKFVELIPSNEILFISTEKADEDKASDKRLIIYTIDGNKFYNKDSMKDIEEKLSKDQNFMRTHYSYIANLKYVRGIQKDSTSGYMLVMKNSDKQVPVSQNYQGQVKAFFGI